MLEVGRGLGSTYQLVLLEHKKADMMAYQTEEGDTLYFCGENCKKAYLAKMDEEKTTE